MEMKVKGRKNEVLLPFYNGFFKITLSLLPSVVLLLLFILRRSDYHSQPNPSSFDDLLANFHAFSAINIWRAYESIYGKIIFFTFLGLVVCSIFNKITKRQVNKSDSFFY